MDLSSVELAKRGRSTDRLLRRATLIDVPAVARLLSPLRAVTDDPVLTELNLPTATRLVLTHVGLELGEFLVAVDQAGQLCAAVVLLPPVHDSDQQALHFALHVELGLLALPDLSAVVVAPEMHWLMLSAAVPGDEAALTALLAAALPVIDEGGLPVLSLQPAPASGALTSAGFVALESGASSLRAALRPGSRTPIRV